MLIEIKPMCIVLSIAVSSFINSCQFGRGRNHNVCKPERRRYHVRTFMWSTRIIIVVVGIIIFIIIKVNIVVIVTAAAAVVVDVLIDVVVFGVIFCKFQRWGNGVRIFRRGRHNVHVVECIVKRSVVRQRRRRRRRQR